MYRNIFFDNRRSEAVLWTWDENGKRVTTRHHFKPHIFIECQNDNGFKSIYNTNLKKVEFKNTWDRNKYIKSSGIHRIFYNIKPEQQFLIEHFGHIKDKSKWTKNSLDTCFLDIEVYTCKYPLSTPIKYKIDEIEKEGLLEDIIVHNLKNVNVWDIEQKSWKSIETSCYTQTSEFPDPEEAKYPINVITLYSTLEKRFYTWGLHGDYTPSQSNVKYIKCATETSLLKSFLRYWKVKEFDVLSGWNSSGFDIPYIMNRINNVLGEEECKKMSPVESTFYRENVGQMFGRSFGRWYIHGITAIDYMEAYKKFARGDRESYSLNYISELELGEGKVKFNATDLSRLAITDWQTFVDYNVQDVNLLVKLDEKLKHIDLIRNISYKGFSQFEGALGTIGVVTGAMAHKAMDRGLVIPTFEHKVKQSYEGGYVREPVTGLQENIISFDANSLYPNTIITLNISPETKLGKIISKDENEVKLQLADGKTYNLTLEKFAAFIKKSNACISKAKVLFSQDKKGFCPEIIEEIYAERVETKKQLQQVLKKIEKLKKKKETDDELTKQAEDLESYQYVLKILLNSLYGTFANNYSPFYDIDIAASITKTGQECIKEASNIFERFTGEKYNITSSNLTLYGDTDSIYCSLDDIFKQEKIKLLDVDGNVTSEALSVAEDLELYLNNSITSWAKKTMNSKDPRFVFKREAMCDVGLFLQKKRYILNVRNDEGVNVNKMKFVGMEVARSSYSQPVKEIIKQIVKSVFTTKNNFATNKVYRDCYDKFKALDLNEICIRTSINDYDKYANRSDKYEIALHTPVHVKGAIYYNNMLKSLNIESKYEQIGSGGKIKWFYTEPNRYQLKVLSYPDTIPPEIESIVKPDYKKMFQKLVTSSITRIFESCNWQIDDLTYEYQTNLFDLFGVKDE